MDEFDKAPEPTIHQLFDLTGRVALVTGGCGHLGSAMCRALAEAGASVVVTSRDSARACELARTLPCNGAAKHFGIALDHMQPDSLATSFAHDPFESALAAEPLGLDHDDAVAIHGGPGNTVAGPLVDRGRLPRQHRLIDARFPLDHFAVDRDRLARPDLDPVPLANFGQRDFDLGAVADHPRGLRR